MEHLLCCLFRISTDLSVVSQVVTNKPTEYTKSRLKLLRMENEAVNQGLNRGHLTPDRMSVALSVLLSKEVHHMLVYSMKQTHTSL